MIQGISIHPIKSTARFYLFCSTVLSNRIWKTFRIRINIKCIHNMFLNFWNLNIDSRAFARWYVDEDDAIRLKELTRRPYCEIIERHAIWCSCIVMILLIYLSSDIWRCELGMYGNDIISPRFSKVSVKVKKRVSSLSLNLYLMRFSYCCHCECNSFNRYIFAIADSGVYPQKSP